MDNRDNFSAKTRNELAKRAGYVCSHPSCGVSTIGPAESDTSKSTYLGRAAHIYSASKDKGPRANPSLSPDERKHINNGIHLCTKCADLIDKNQGIDFPAELLIQWKHKAEEQARIRLQHTKQGDPWRKVGFRNLEVDYSAALASTALYHCCVARQVSLLVA